MEEESRHTLAEALSVGEEVFRRAIAAVPSLPTSSNYSKKPNTFSEALTYVQQQDEERRRDASAQPKSKSKAQPAPAPEPTFPGCVVGATDDRSAFWYYVEVCRTCSAASCMPACSDTLLPRTSSGMSPQRTSRSCSPECWTYSRTQIFEYLL
jgi:hypothetical protein